MAEFDLTPPTYRRRLELRRWALRAVAAYVGAAVLLGGVGLALAVQISEGDRAVHTLTSERKQAERLQARVEHLRMERDSLRQSRAVLAGLRGGFAATEMFAVVDRALNEDVWFDRWTFGRAGEIVDSDPEATTNGYFVVLPRRDGDDREKAWRFETHMEIDALAKDHRALASFVRKLAVQREIEGARILETRRRRVSEGELVDGELAIVVRSLQ